MMPDAKPKAHPLCFSSLLSDPACLNRMSYVLDTTVAQVSTPPKSQTVVNQ